MAEEEPGTQAEDGEFTVVPSLADDQEQLVAVPSEDEDSYKLAVGLIALWKVMGMTQAEAWRALHPNDAEVSDDAVKMRSHRAIRWFQERYELRWRDLLEMCNLGRFRILHEVEQALKAVTWCRWRKREVPDWKTREGARRDMMVMNGVTSHGDYLKDLALTGKTEQKAIEVGPPPETHEEWMAMALKVDAELRKHYQKPPDELAQ
ncbi:MAG: hypothetical protein OXC31_11870 [Spirochaetaceae bacterium]|nr:hypothetical protein [Spirochaetaceae bacterium]